jgi:aerobic-type carbon monoxide dehydrogenase small subunit (CoxS/CutS family)
MSRGHRSSAANRSYAAPRVLLNSQLERASSQAGLPARAALHPLQPAFITNDGSHCGYCTSGQICSAVAMLDEHAAGTASAATVDVAASTIPLSNHEIRERMSGNLCRCGAYHGIVATIEQVATAAESHTDQVAI